MHLRELATVTATALASACGGNLYSVNSSGEGIPFHPVEQYAVTTNVYKEDVHTLEVTLQILKGGDPKVVLREVSEQVHTSDGQCASDLVAAFSKGDSAVEGYLAFRAVRSQKSCAAAQATPLRQRSWQDMKAIVAQPNAWIAQQTDHRTRLSKQALYINVSKAAIGTTSGTVKLNEKGQLTEAAASSDDKTASTIIEAVGALAELASGQLPIKDLLLDKWGLTPADTQKAQTFTGTGTPPKAEDVRATLKYSYRPRLYSVECEVGKACDPPVAFSMTEIGGIAVDKKEADGGKVEFSGSVKLPKPKAEK